MGLEGMSRESLLMALGESWERERMRENGKGGGKK
uniref:Uncharacterized protein n=1 Tax=Nelumbo nucifera TaxID=4432 RepID=A0A822Z324_NELNU|nr:TPA_asm: hypothetical protein HUJ06_008490 [Nelumbo nucifera]